MSDTDGYFRIPYYQFNIIDEYFTHSFFYIVQLCKYLSDKAHGLKCDLTRVTPVPAS